MKETDFAYIQSTIAEIVEPVYNSLPLSDVMPLSIFKHAVFLVYVTNDEAKSIGQDYRFNSVDISFITTRNRCSCICNQAGSWQYSDEPAICMYEEITDDVQRIVRILNLVYIRTQA